MLPSKVNHNLTRLLPLKKTLVRLLHYRLRKATCTLELAFATICSLFILSIWLAANCTIPKLPGSEASFLSYISTVIYGMRLRCCEL